VLRKVVRVVAVVYITYIALSVLVVMPAANFFAPRFVQENYGRELRTDIIIFNPFTLTAEVRGASLLERDGSPFAALERATVNLSLASALGQGLVFNEVSVLGLKLHVRRTGPEEFNFSDMLADGNNESETQPPGEMPALTVQRLSFTAERISLTDEAREEPFTTHYEGLDIAVTDLSTVVAEGKPYRIDATAESGGALRWEGTVSLPGASSQGSLSVSNLSLQTLWRFARPWLNFELRDGRAGIRGDYSISWADGFAYQVSGGEVELEMLDLQALDPGQLPDTGITLESLRISGIEVNGTEQNLEVAAVDVGQLSIAGWSEGDRVSLVELFAVQGLPESEPDAEEATQSAPWTATVADIRLQDSDVSWRSEFTDPPLMKLSPLSARAQSISWPLQGDSPLSLEFTVNQQTQLKMDGSLALASGEGTINYELDQLPLAWFNPNLPSALKAHITDGQLQVSGALNLGEFLPQLVQMNGAITSFSGTMEGSEESLTRWDAVRWEQLEVDLEKRQVYLAKLQLHDYEGRVHIAEDGSINASKVWQDEVGEKADELVEELEWDQPWKVEIPEIYISESAIDFKDESLPIPFRTVIGDVNGEILNINSAPGAQAKVDIKGSVDGYAPVTLAGTAVPLGEPPALDLALNFTGVDLVLLTPYSGTYAGYAIERGLLNLALEYSLENDRIKGKNDIVIDQLKLGEKVESDKALDLPLELALALLTDANGVIDLKVPVEGDVNDPEFALGSVIAGAFVNLVTKAVTAPFALLANLVGAEDDLQRLAFPVGGAELTDPGKLKLEQLHQALAERPRLTLVINGSLNLAADREQLQRAMLDEQLLAQGLTQEDISSRTADYIATVENRYEALIGGNAGDASFSEKYSRVLQDINISEDELRSLAQARGVVVKEYLVNELGLGADRAALEQATQLEAESQTFSGVTLGLES
jgi:Domain of Unknown Function (DUF748)